MIARLFDRLGGRARPAVVFLAVAIALVATSAAFHQVVYSSEDEGWQLGIMRGTDPRVSPNPLDLYHFHGPGIDEPYMDRGLYPWWNDVGQKFALFRPLSSAVWLIETRLFGANVVVAYAHSLLWLLALAWAASGVFFEALTPRAASISTLLFATAHGLSDPIIVPSNRHTLVTMTFSCMALSAYLRWRKTSVRAHLFRALLFHFLASLSGETAVVMLAYPVSFELLAPTRPRRIQHLGALALVGGGFFLAYRLAGLGIRHVHDYAEPFAEPTRYLERIPFHLPMLWLDGLTGLAAWAMGKGLIAIDVRYFLASGIVVLLGVLLGIAFLAKRKSGYDVPTWTVLASCATLPLALSSWFRPSLAIAGSLGFSALFGVVADSAGQLARERSGGGTTVFRWVAIALVGIRGVSEPALLAAEAKHHTAQVSVAAERYRAIPFDGARQFILVGPPQGEGDAFDFMAGPPAFLSSAMDAWFTLSVSPGTQRLTRTDARTLVWEGTPDFHDEYIYFRNDDRAFVGGERVDVRGLSALVEEVAGPFPTRVRFTFAGDLDDPSYRLLRFAHHALVPVPMPSIGSVVELKSSVSQ